MDIGIDLGTTFSVIAVEGKVELAPDYPGGNGIYLEDCDVTVIPSPCGENTFPSVMIEDPENPQNWLFGSEALQKSEEGLAPVMFSKRKIGTLEEIPVANGTVMAKDVAARFLGYLKHHAEQALGQPVRRAAVTHPAYFDRGAVEETRDAARAAGFDMDLPQQMLMEPTAAALAYTRTDPRDPLRILTYDLGGGTFDVTYMERIDGVIQIRGFDGNHLLGGYNFDKELVRLVRSRLEAKGRKIHLNENDPIDRGRLARLLRIAENVKIDLSKAQNDTDPIEFRVRNVLVDDKGASVQVNERITRQQFVEAIQPWLDETVACCRNALVKGKARPEDLHQILLVGGSSYGPWVSASLQAAFPGAQMRLFSPDLCVGAGAAIHARMSLPHGQILGDYRIECDTPATSVLDHISVSGRFLLAADRQPPLGAMSVALELAAGSPPAPLSLGKDGSFLFQGVALATEGENKLKVCLRNSKGQTVAEHGLTIGYLPPASSEGAASNRGAARISGSTSVLPRPLYVETARGMVALAEEGVALPAKSVAHFERTNSNPNITLKLFQEQDPVGSVRIENIPEDAGIGSPVELTIEVTADNQVCGDVVIYRLIRAEGKTPRQVEALRSPIRVTFDPTAIPSAEDLAVQFGELQERVAMLPLIDAYLQKEVAGESETLIDRIRRGFERQPFERQEVYVDIRRLRHLLLPPKDDMTPSRREFVQVVGSCRKDMEQLRSTNHTILAELKKDGKEELTIDGKTVSSRRTTAVISRLAELERKLDDLEQTGLAAYAKKDRIAWPKGFERIRGLSADVDKLKPPAPDMSKLPTPLLKLLVLHQEIAPRMELVRKHALALAQVSELGDWMKELADLERQMQAAGDAVLKIGDDIPSPQALAQIHEVLKTVRALDERIASLGKSLH